VPKILVATIVSVVSDISFEKTATNHAVSIRYTRHFGKVDSLTEKCRIEQVLFTEDKIVVVCYCIALCIMLPMLKFSLANSIHGKVGFISSIEVKIMPA